MRVDQARECLVCDYCRHQHFPEPNADGVRVLGVPAAVCCPLCRTPLVVASAGGEPLLYCERCRGMLIEVRVFVELVQELRARSARAAVPPPPPVDQAELTRPAACPHCGRKMDTHPYAGPGNVVIDNCPRCGVNWLDHSELRRIAEAPDSAINPDGWTAPEGWTPPD